MAKMRVGQFSKQGGSPELVEREIPEPGPGEVRLRVEACGVCHSDVLVRAGIMPGAAYPRVPGHEVAGVVDALGPGASGWKQGDRAGVGWHGGSCGHCALCRGGDSFACPETPVTGISRDGGWGEYVVANASALAAIPEGLSAADAAPLLCAGVTTFNALRNSGARPGDLVAVLGLGGLGHLGVQYAAKMGFRTVAIARGPEKAAFARELGASEYVDSQAGDPAAALQRWGGARVVLATVTDGPAMAATVPGLAPRGKLLVLGAPPVLQVSPFDLIAGRRSVEGAYSGTSLDSADALAFSVLQGVRSRNEVFPLSRLGEAFARMESGKARFRVVLSMKP